MGLGDIDESFDADIRSDKGSSPRTRQSSDQTRNPNLKSLRFPQAWVQRPITRNVYLTGQNSNIWSKPDIVHMVALKTPSTEVLFSISNFLNRALSLKYHQSLRACTGIVSFI